MPSKQRAVVIGAGVVGLSAARLFARRGFETYVLDAEDAICRGVSSRNSGVIHASLYYPPGSLKSRLCLEGRRLLYDWCATHPVSHRKVGKLVVATDSSELAPLEALFKNAQASGATEVRMLESSEIRSMELHVNGIAALFSPETGIIDPHDLADSLLRDAEDHGTTLVTHSRVTRIDRTKDGYTIHSGEDSIDAHVVINSAGLYADEVARMVGVEKYRIYPWRGDYFTFRPGREFSHLVYPVKKPKDPGLGVHLTMDLQGKLRLGPDAESVDSKDDFHPREDKLDKFYESAKRLFPWATKEMLSYDMCGIRPKLRSPDSATESDFVISEDLPGFFNLVGTDSPGLTAALAIGQNLLETFK